VRILVTLLATISNYYNYALFGLAAGFISQEFVPGGLNHVFGILAFAVLVKPVASIIFGTIGDLYGRAAALKIATAASMLSMVTLSLLPNFNSIGSLAVISLFISRVLVLASVTGESDGARIYITEQMSSKNLNFANGLVSLTTQLGVLTASLVVFILTQNAISLRVAFICGSLLNLIVIFLRNYITESKEFTSSKTSPSKHESIKPFIRNNWQILLTAVVINGCIGGIYHFYIIFMSSYAANIFSDQTHLLTIASILCYAIFSPISGFIADKFGLKTQSSISLLLSMLMCAICIWEISQIGQTSRIFILAQLILLPFYSIPLQIYIKNFIPVGFRYRGFSLCHSIGSTIISSPTPLIASLIWTKTQVKWLNFCYPMVLLMVLFCCLCYIRKHEKYHLVAHT
jgi:MHS family proline/betaine transporter-like MFS transporter